MYVAVQCRHCQNWSRVSEDLLERRVRCPDCGRTFHAERPHTEPQPTPEATPKVEAPPLPRESDPFPVPNPFDTEQEDRKEAATSASEEEPDRERKRNLNVRAIRKRKRRDAGARLMGLGFIPLILPAFIYLICPYFGREAASGLFVSLPIALLATITSLVLLSRDHTDKTKSIAVCLAIGLTFLLSLLGIQFLDKDWTDLDDAQWTVTTIEDADCIIDMPGTLSKHDQSHEVNVSRGAKYRVSFGNPATSFVLSWADYDALAEGVSLERMAEQEKDALDEVYHNRVQETEVSAGAYTGRELQVRRDRSLGRGYCIERIFLVDQGVFSRLYLLRIEGPDVSNSDRATRRFLDSFQIHLKPVKLDVPSPKNLKGLIACWAFDQPNAHLQALDSSDHALHGAFVQDRKEKGIRELAGVLTGKGYVKLPDAPDLNFKKRAPFTIAGWVKTEAAEGMIFCWRGLPGKIEIQLEEGKFRSTVRDSRFGGGDENRKRTSSRVNNGEWHHFALTRDAQGFINLFVDGRLEEDPEFFDQQNEAQEEAIVTSSRFLGRTNNQNFRNDNPLVGSLDEICVFDRQLTDAEILQLAGRGG